MCRRGAVGAVVRARGGDRALELLVTERHSLGRSGRATGEHLDRHAWDDRSVLDHGVDAFEAADKPGVGLGCSRDLDAHGTNTGCGVADAGAGPVVGKRDHRGYGECFDLRRQRLVALVGADGHDAAAGDQRAEHGGDHRRVVAQHEPHRSAERHAVRVEQSCDRGRRLGAAIPTTSSDPRTRSRRRRDRGRGRS